MKETEKKGAYERGVNANVHMNVISVKRCTRHRRRRRRERRRFS